MVVYLKEESIINKKLNKDLINIKDKSNLVHIIEYRLTKVLNYT